MFKKSLVLLMVMIMLIGIVGIMQAKDTVTIDFLNFSGGGDNAKYLEAMKEAFEKQHPDIKVNIEAVGFGEYFTQLQTRVAGGTAPDCFELNYENFVTYAKKGALRELDSLIEASNFDVSVINENALKAFQADGVQYGLPASFSNVVLFFNKDLFDQAGVAYPTSDWNYKDAEKAALEISKLGNHIFGYFQPIHFFEFFKTVQQNNGSLFNEDKTKFTVNRPENVETLQIMVDRVRKTNIMPGPAQLSGMGDWDIFCSGRLGMIITGIWSFPYFTENCDFAWDIAVEPGIKKKATHFFSNGLVINKDSEKAEAAFKWITFMASSREAAKIRVDAGWELPAVTYPDILEAYKQKTPPDNREAVFESLNYLITPPVIEQFAEMADILTGYLEKARDGVMTPQEALDAAQKELESNISLN
jgi:multiple sugar transport system substrate-binding protein